MPTQVEYARQGIITPQMAEVAEVCKAKAAEKAGADTLMELSVGGDLDRVRPYRKKNVSRCRKVECNSPADPPL